MLLTTVQTWETRYVLLLWLSIVCMIPFDMARFDGLKDTTDGGLGRRRPVVERILETAKVCVIQIKADRSV